MQSNPYEYYNGRLGVKMSYIICDRNADANSLALITYNALNLRIKSKTCLEQQLRKASYNIPALIDYASLSQSWKNLLARQFGNPQEEVQKSWFSEHYQTDGKAFDFFAAYRYGEDNKKLDPALIDRYAYNASVLNTVIKMKANRKSYAKALGCTNLDIWDSLSRDVNSFREVEHNLPATSRGLRLKVSDYQKNGYEALISGRLQNQNATKVRDNEQVALIDELLAKHTNLDNAQVANLYNMVAIRLDWKTITAQTVGNHKQERNLIIYAGRNGKAKLLDNKLMQNKRIAPTAPMLYWTMDGWDAELLYQKTEIDGKGRSVTTYHNRLTVVMVLDPFNKYIVGYAIGTHETPDLIKAALRNAMQHVNELFGAHYRPYQLQTDRYSIKALTPTYNACSTHFTPAKVNNKKTKVIEPFFNWFNKQYCQMFNNWSGHNVDSGSVNQPNDEMLNKLRHTFPDEQGCRQQLITSIEADRSKKQGYFTGNWANVSEDFQSIMPYEMYLQYLGQTTGFTNRLQGDGLNPTIQGQPMWYDSFDLDFRKHAHLDWVVKYDSSDLSKVLVVNAEKKAGKIQEIGTYQFLLNQKYVQPMALADRNEGDALQLKAVKDFNNDAMAFITDIRQQNADTVHELFSTKPQLQDTLAKLILTDSNGQHKNRLSEGRAGKKAKEVNQAVQAQTDSQKQKSWQAQQNEYYREKINIKDYI